MNLTVRLEEKIRPFLLPMILGVTALGILLIAILPQLNRLKINSRDLSDRRKAAEILETKLSSLETLDEISQAETLETVLAALPSEEPFREALLNLDTLLIRHRIGASQIKVESAADYLSIEFTGVAPMSDIKSFISDADNVLPLSATVSIAAARADHPSASDSSPVYQSTIIVRILFQSPPQTIGRASDLLPRLTADHLKTLKLLSEFERILPASADDSIPNTVEVSRLFPE